MTTLAAVRAALAGHRAREERAPEARPAAVSVVLVEDAGDVAALFIQRAERPGDPWSGQIAFPGGRHDPGDADLLATAIRETREEVGVDLAGAERLGVLDDLYPRTPVLPPVVVRPYVFALARRPPLRLDAEVRDAFWVPFAALRAADARRDVTIPVLGVELVFPAYRVAERVVWGMTERILTGFLGLVAGDQESR